MGGPPAPHIFAVLVILAVMYVRWKDGRDV